MTEHPAQTRARAAEPGVVELDVDRVRRRGYPEAIYCEGKSLEDLRTIARLVAQRPQSVHLFTRADAEKAEAILEILPDAHHDPVADVGIAGVHRTLAHTEEFRAAGAIIVAAGMDGALPGLIAGLVACPVVALPTSVGYGAALNGLAPLLTMLNACAPGVGVVNIDNGYGAGHLAAQITAPR
ncbi:AIR carboxylase family protein [Schaalia hyovaginalis]|uniref:AIR carboxylase family protein n=1 Tax=Schaalia hyovaginalis TaxID=29316 RepID=UPI001F2D5C77|nr:AIR carboxylase family protein [Schaalia hyovaginalis]MCF2711992.1 AIR carboxylase family protein [Schaalia hyovaginalis]